MALTKFDTKEMLNSKMERQQHRGSLFRLATKFGQSMAGNDNILVIDISYWQDHTRINYDELCKHIKGVILRGTYGIWKDTRVDIHYAELVKRNIPVGFYCYLIGNYTGKQQADKFYEAIGNKEMKLGIWADIEDRRPGTAMSRKVAEEFMAECDRKFGRRTDIYTGPYAWKAIMVTGGHSHRRLWIANYYVSKPMMPSGGDWLDWWLWQYTDKGKNPGYYGSLDHNRYNGTTAQWYKDIESEPTTPEPDPPPTEGLLNVPLFSQKDTRWASDKLGTSSVTIGGYGCLITATAMVCNFFGKTTDPRRINQDLIRVNGYVNGNLLSYNSITNIYPDIRVSWSNYLSNPSNIQIDVILKRKLPVIAQVDFVPSTSILDQHWVVIIGKNANGYVIIDPIDGKIAPLSKFANKVYRMVVYEQATTPTEEAMYTLEFTGSLYIRERPIDGKEVQRAVKGDILYSYEKPDRGWYKVTKGNITGWVSGNTTWTRITQNPTEPDPVPGELTVEERLTRIEKHLGLN